MGNNTYDIFQESDSIEKINPSSKLSSIDNYYKNGNYIIPSVLSLFRANKQHGDRDKPKKAKWKVTKY